MTRGAGHRPNREPGESPGHGFRHPENAVRHYAALYLTLEVDDRAGWLESAPLDDQVYSVGRTIRRGAYLDGHAEPIRDFWSPTAAAEHCASCQRASDSSEHGDLFTVTNRPLRELVVEEAAGREEDRTAYKRSAEQRRRRRMGMRSDPDAYWSPILEYAEEGRKMTEEWGPIVDLADPAILAELGVTSATSIEDLDMLEMIYVDAVAYLQWRGWDITKLLGTLTPDLFWDRYGRTFERMIDDYELSDQSPQQGRAAQ